MDFKEFNKSYTSINESGSIKIGNVVDIYNFKKELNLILVLTEKGVAFKCDKNILCFKSVEYKTYINAKKKLSSREIKARNEFLGVDDEKFEENKNNNEYIMVKDITF